MYDGVILSSLAVQVASFLAQVDYREVDWSADIVRVVDTVVVVEDMKCILVEGKEVVKNWASTMAAMVVLPIVVVAMKAAARADLATAVMVVTEVAVVMVVLPIVAARADLATAVAVIDLVDTTPIAAHPFWAVAMALAIAVVDLVETVTSKKLLQLAKHHFPR